GFSCGRQSAGRARGTAIAAGMRSNAPHIAIAAGQLQAAIEDFPVKSVLGMLADSSARYRPLTSDRHFFKRRRFPGGWAPHRWNSSAHDRTWFGRTTSVGCAITGAVRARPRAYRLGGALTTMNSRQ